MTKEGDMPRKLDILFRRHGVCGRCGSYKDDLILFAKGESKIYICYDCLSAAVKRVINAGLLKGGDRCIVKGALKTE